MVDPDGKWFDFLRGVAQSFAENAASPTYLPLEAGGGGGGGAFGAAPTECPFGFEPFGGECPEIQGGTVEVPFIRGARLAGRLGRLAWRVVRGLRAGKAGVQAIEAAELSVAQASNYARYVRKLPAGAGTVKIIRLADGSVRFSADVPGRVPGSFARYIKIVDASGRTTGYVKETYDPTGTLVGSKIKFPR